MKPPSDIKTILFGLCLQYTEQRIAIAQEFLDNATESVNDETKSSAGDKHETGRAMAQIEQEKAAKQLAEAMAMKNDLLRLDVSHQLKSAGPGSVVITNNGNFFISVPAGNMKAEGKLYYAVSPSSPIGQALSGLKQGAEFRFNGKKFIIETLE